MNYFIYKGKICSIDVIIEQFGCNKHTVDNIIRRVNNEQITPVDIFDYKKDHPSKIFFILKNRNLLSAQQLAKLTGISIQTALLRIKKANKGLLNIDRLLECPNQAKEGYKTKFVREEIKLSEYQQKLLDELQLTPKEIEIQNRFY